MAFKVQIVAAAQRDISEVVDFIHQDSPASAKKWLQGLSAAIQSLAEMPLRFTLIPEAHELKRPLRSFPYYSHRVVYEVEEASKTVSIIRVYHSARALLSPHDLPK